MTAPIPPFQEQNVSPQWMKKILLAAALYNIIWGAWVVLFPASYWHWMGMPLPNYLELWQCIGMIVGVYGVGYGIAAFDPYRHWPIVLVGFLGKVFGPLGFVFALVQGTLPLSFGITNLTNDLIWWVPFFLILKGAFESWLDESEEVKSILGSEKDHFSHQLKLTPLRWVQSNAENKNELSETSSEVLSLEDAEGTENLWRLSQERPLLVVFLRHFGCTFCRETLAELAKVRNSIESTQFDGRGVEIVVVHMSSVKSGNEFLKRYGLEDLRHISDPYRRLYKLFGLRRGRLSQLFGLQVWIRGFQAGVLNGHGVGSLQGDGFQMPG
ncbi:MAG: redoxin domain-containing protein, partial [Cyanobacteria bacterium]|nr:redoxin domain-containing protein [Cyanobacteriota bacterium]